MRVLAAILFIVGIPWAWIAWIAIGGGPLGAIEDLLAAIHRPERLPGAILQIPVLLAFSAHAALGYFIWIKWIRIAFYDVVATARFWLIATLHHAIWTLIAAAALLQSDRMPILDAIFIYSVIVILVCAIATFISCRGSGRDGTSDSNTQLTAEAI